MSAFLSPNSQVLLQVSSHAMSLLSRVPRTIVIHLSQHWDSTKSSRFRYPSSFVRILLDSHIYSSIVSFLHSLIQSLAHSFSCASPYAHQVSSPFLAISRRTQLRLSLAFWLHFPINLVLDSMHYSANPFNWTSHAVHATLDYSLKSATNSLYSVSMNNHLIIWSPYLLILIIPLIPTHTTT